MFDDPISSLDNEVLFLVVGLIRRLYESVRSGSGRIKQLFVLTHNVYFHKEVAYDPRGDLFGTDVTYWIVRKPDNNSNLRSYGVKNPISTSYQLLWEELTREERPSPTLQNVMRRILEQYFKILGDIKFESIVDKFEGADQVICDSLLKWLHDGSHSVNDDVFVALDETLADKYRSVFKEIFHKLGHSAHYEMMMSHALKLRTATA